MPCSNSTVCLLAQACLEELNICFRSLVFAEWDGLLGMPTSTKASLQPTKPIKRIVKKNPSYVLSELTEGMTITEKNLSFFLTELLQSSQIITWSELRSQKY